MIHDVQVGWSTAVIVEVLRKAMAVTAADNPSGSRDLRGGVRISRSRGSIECRKE